MDSNTDTEIEIIPDEPQPETVVEPIKPDKEDDTVRAAPQPNVASEESLAALKRQLESVSRENETVKAEVAKYRDEGQRSYASRLHAEEVNASNVIIAADEALVSLRAELAQKQQQGDFDGAALTNQRMLEKIQDKRDAERYKEDVARRKITFERQVEQEQRAQQERAQQPKLPEQTQRWINAHPQFLDQNSAFHRKAMQGHYAALADGLEEGSEAYFSMVDTYTGERPAQNGNGQAATQERQPSRGTASIPPSRATAVAPSGQQFRKITLTAAEKEMADITMSSMYPDPKVRYAKYAQNRDKMLRDNPLTGGA